jgi:hypothetical protein
MVGGRRVPPFVLATEELGPALDERTRRKLIDRSRDRYATRRAEVEAQIGAPKPDLSEEIAERVEELTSARETRATD